MPTSSRGRASQGTARAAFAGVTLLVLGLGFWAVFRITWGSEQHSYARGIAPMYAQVQKGHTYSLDMRGGVAAEKLLGVDPQVLSCSAAAPGGSPVALHVDPESADTKATDQIGTFVAPSSGRIHVDCSGLPALFVDNAEGAQADVSGWWLVLATIALTVGVPLTLSVVRRARLSGQPGDQHQVERGVDVGIRRRA